MTTQSKPITVRGTAWSDSKAQIVRVELSGGSRAVLAADETGGTVNFWDADGRNFCSFSCSYGESMQIAWKAAQLAVSP